MLNMIDWHDVIRIVALLVNVYSICILLYSYNHENLRWGTKARDLWYALLVWSVSGVVFAGQGVVLDRPVTAGFILLTAATMVTGKVVHSRGPGGL